MKRLGASAKTKNLIDQNLIKSFYEQHKDEELKDYQWMKNDLDSNYSTSGVFAVDDLENPTRYFAIDMQQCRKKNTEYKCIVAIVEIDPETKQTTTPDIRLEYGSIRNISKNCNLVSNGVQLQLVKTNDIDSLLENNFEKF